MQRRRVAILVILALRVVCQGSTNALAVCRSAGLNHKLPPALATKVSGLMLWSRAHADVGAQERVCLTPRAHPPQRAVDRVCGAAGPSSARSRRAACCSSRMQLFNFGDPWPGTRVGGEESEQTRTTDRLAGMRPQRTRGRAPPVSSPQTGVFSQAGRGKSVPQNQDTAIVTAGRAGGPTLVGVLDGHGPRGSYVAQTAAASLRNRLEPCTRGAVPPPQGGDWERVFADVDAQLQGQIGPGCGGATASLALVCPCDRSLSLAWVGDSRVIAASGRRGGGGVAGRALTTDHTSDNPAEVRRIIKAGGVLLDSSTGVRRAASTGTARRTPPGADKTETLFRFKASRGVACTRSLGDFDQRPFCMCTPSTSTTTLKADEVVLLATDGVWDVIPNEEAAEIVLEARARGQDANAAAKMLGEIARARWVQYTDNTYVDDITIVLVLPV